jgi:hypothetical protein
MLPLVDYRDSQEHLNAIEKFTMICAEQTTYIFKLCPPSNLRVALVRGRPAQE